MNTSNSVFRSQVLSDENTCYHVLKYLHKCVINSFKTIQHHM